MKRKKRPPIHHSIRERLGYDESLSDKELLKNWKKRSSQVCKPCWELKYCPYGPFVEQSPLLPVTRDEATKHNEYLRRCLESGVLGEPGPLPPSLKERYEAMVAAPEEEWPEFADMIPRYLLKEPEAEEPFDNEAWDEISSDLGPIEQYQVPFSLLDDDNEVPELSVAQEEVVRRALERMRGELAAGVMDPRRPLDNNRRERFEKDVSEFDPNNYPEKIPKAIAAMQCNIFGHICPVVFVGEAVTETSEDRRRGRYLAFKIRIRVVRRDNYTCQHCGKHLRDDEVEFDHIIPIAKGGSSEEHNIRLTCFECNRGKSDKMKL